MHKNHLKTFFTYPRFSIKDYNSVVIEIPVLNIIKLLYAGQVYVSESKVNIYAKGMTKGDRTYDTVPSYDQLY